MNFEPTRPTFISVSAFNRLNERSANELTLRVVTEFWEVLKKNEALLALHTQEIKELRAQNAAQSKKLQALEACINELKSEKRPLADVPENVEWTLEFSPHTNPVCFTASRGSAFRLLQSPKASFLDDPLDLLLRANTSDDDSEGNFFMRNQSQAQSHDALRVDNMSSASAEASAEASAGASANKKACAKSHATKPPAPRPKSTKSEGNKDKTTRASQTRQGPLMPAALKAYADAHSSELSGQHAANLHQMLQKMMLDMPESSEETREQRLGTNLLANYPEEYVTAFNAFISSKAEDSFRALYKALRDKTKAETTLRKRKQKPAGEESSQPTKLSKCAESNQV